MALLIHIESYLNRTFSSLVHKISDNWNPIELRIAMFGHYRLHLSSIFSHMFG